MKKSLIQIKNKIKGLISFKNINPHHHWRNLLYIFLLIIILLILFSFYVFYKMRNQQELEIKPKSTKSPSLINEKLLNKVTESFENKSLKEKEIKEGLVIYKDPSMN